MRLSALIRLWFWLTLLAVAAFAVLSLLEQRLKAATGFGLLDLQNAQTAYDYKRAFAAWIAREHAATAGFCLGFAFVFLPLYALSFYFSALLAREAFAPKKGLLRRLIDYLGFVPLLGALANAIAAALAFTMLSGGASDSNAYAASVAGSVASTCFAIGLGLLVAGVAGVLKLRRPKAEDDSAS